MSDVASPDFLQIDWSRLPAPVDDGAARHLPGLAMPDVPLPATDGSTVSRSRLAGRTVVYAYPMTGRPGAPLPDGWDDIPGARGCTPQNCAFRDHHAELLAAGADRVFGLSTQDTKLSARGRRAAAPAVPPLVGCGASPDDRADNFPSCWWTAPRC